MSTIVPGYGDAFPKLVLVNPDFDAEPRLLRALHVAGVAARDTGRDGDGQKLFGARIVADPATEWDDLARWTRAIVAFGPDAWSATLRVLALEGPDFAPGLQATTDDDRPVTVVAAGALGDAGLSDADLAGVVATAQDLAGLSWGCGGRSPAR